MKYATLIRAIIKGVAAAIMGGAIPAHAQGCALCYSQAASASSRFIHGLRGGILVLVFPPLLISAALAITAYRKRDSFHRSESQMEHGPALVDDKTHDAK